MPKQVQVSTPQASKERILVFPDNELDVAVVYDAEGYNKVCNTYLLGCRAERQAEAQGRNAA